MFPDAKTNSKLHENWGNCLGPPESAFSIKTKTGLDSQGMAEKPGEFSNVQQWDYVGFPVRACTFSDRNFSGQSKNNFIFARNSVA